MGSEFVVLPAIRGALEALKALIESHQHILVTMHSRPDGDAIGSAVAFYHILRALGKDVTLFNVDVVPSQFEFLLPDGLLKRQLLSPEAIELCLVLDCAEPRLLGKAFPFEALSCPFVYIDHHAKAWTDCALTVHDSRASATGELIYHAMRALEVPLTQVIAEALYTAIITDTGSFRYSSTSPDALRVSAALLDSGFDVWQLASAVYENNPVEKVQLLGDVLQTLWRSADGRLACMHASRDLLRKHRCSGAMTDGFINYARSIRGVEVSLFLTELEPKCYRLSFRSRGQLDVSQLAAQFGGGGHKNAAACNIEGSIEEIRERIASCLAELWSSSVLSAAAST